MAASQKLPSKYARIAKSELGEDPKNVPAHLEAFRRWLSSMPHLTCPDDDQFLIMFLRHCKYSHAKAQARLDNFCTLSTMKCIGEEIWSTPVDLESKELRHYLDKGIHLPLGYTEDGKMAICLRPGEWNPDEFAFPRLFYYAYKVMFMVAFDPRTIIGGSVIIINLANVTPNQILKDPNVIRALVLFSQESIPGRVKRVFFYNESKIIGSALSIFLFYMKDKVKKRLQHIGSDISKAFEVEPGLKAILPPEYGGDGKPLAELIKDNRKHFYEFYGQGDPTSEIRVDESKRPVSARAYLREYKDYDPNVMGTSGTFIKINQDEI